MAAPQRERHPARGYALAAAAAAMWALNGSMARYLLDDGVGPFELSELRSLGSWLILLVALAVTRPELLRVERDELPSLAVLGVAGLAAVHASYFAAIERLEIGPAVTIQYLAPLLLLVWLRVVHHRRIARGLWGAVLLSAAGCFLVVRAYDAGDLDGIGVLAAFGAAVSFAIYMVGSERAGHRHEPVTTLFWAFGFASLFWALAAPWWNFPFGEFGSAAQPPAGGGRRRGGHAAAVHLHGGGPQARPRPPGGGRRDARAGAGGGLRLGHPRRGARGGAGGGRNGRRGRRSVGPVPPPGP